MMMVKVTITKMITLMTEHKEIHLLFPFKPQQSHFILIIKLEPKLSTCQVTIRPIREMKATKFKITITKPNVL